MYSEKVHCTNFCIAESREKAEEHYSEKYQWGSVKPAAEWEVNSCKRRGMR